MHRNLPRYIIGGCFFVLGPVAMIAYGAWSATSIDTRTATAEATVVRVEFHRGSGHSRTECPVFQFSAGDVPTEAESNRCDVDLAPGDRLQVRYDPDDPQDVVPVDDYDAHPEAAPVIAATLLCSAISAFFLWPDRKKPTRSTSPSDPSPPSPSV